MSDQMAAVARSAARNPYGDQRYTPPEAALQSASKPLVKAVLRRALLWCILPTIVGFLVLASTSLASDNGYGGYDDGPSFGSVISGVLFLAAQAGLILALIIPLREQLSEWQTLLAGRAGAADSAFAAIYQVLRTREVPVAVTARRFRTGTGKTDNVLSVTGESARVVITVFPYGTGLYLGWSMWRNRFPLPLLWHALLETVSAGASIERTMHRTIRTSRLRALREAVASAAAEGVDVAITNTEVPLAATFGFEIPITDMSTPASPAAAPVPVRPTATSGATPTPTVGHPAPPKPPALPRANPTAPMSTPSFAPPSPTAPVPAQHRAN